jgi:hypothetical protein
MTSRATTTLVIVALVLVIPAAAAGYSERSVGSRSQIAWVRSAARRFLTAETAGNGAGACAILIAKLRAPLRGHTCEARWNARLASQRRDHGARSRLRTDLRAVGSARVVVHGNVASIELPAPLLHGATRFLWTENCWMLED